MGDTVAIETHQCFAAVAKIWLETRTFDSLNPQKRARYIAPRTLHDYGYYLETLNKFFGQIPLKDISIGHIRSYQRERSAAVGPNKINSETAILKRVMLWAKCWNEALELAFQPLQSQEPDVARAMTPKEQENFLGIAGSCAEWDLVHWFSLAALKTTLTDCEMTGLKIGDIQFRPVAILNVRSRHAKNKYRVRTIGLGSEAAWAFSKIVERAQRLGATSRDHFIFPFRVKRNDFDPTRPMTAWGIRKGFDQVRRSAGVPWLRIHDLRHTAITRLAEGGTALPTIMSMAGHISPRMMQHYTHISLQAQCSAQEKVSGNQAVPATVAPERQPVVRKAAAKPPQGAYSMTSDDLATLIATILKK